MTIKSISAQLSYASTETGLSLAIHLVSGANEQTLTKAEVGPKIRKNKKIA